MTDFRFNQDLSILAGLAADGVRSDAMDLADELERRLEDFFQQQALAAVQNQTSVQTLSFTNTVAFTGTTATAYTGTVTLPAGWGSMNVSIMNTSRVRPAATLANAVQVNALPNLSGTSTGFLAAYESWDTGDSATALRSIAGFPALRGPFTADVTYDLTIRRSAGTEAASIFGHRAFITKYRVT